MVKAVIVELHGNDNSGDVVRYTVADDTAISKGTLCKIEDPRTASAATGTGEPFAGIASVDKEANDGATTLGMFTNGIFDIVSIADVQIHKGDLVAMSGADLIRAAVAADVISGAIVGKALEDEDTASEVIAVKVGRVV